MASFIEASVLRARIFKANRAIMLACLMLLRIPPAKLLDEENVADDRPSKPEAHLPSRTAAAAAQVGKGLGFRV